MECTAESSCENSGSQAQPTREEDKGGQGLVWHKGTHIPPNTDIPFGSHTVTGLSF